MNFKQTLGLCLLIISSFFIFSVNASDNIAIEETTPPPAEKAYTLEQIPPIDTTEKSSKNQNAKTSVKTADMFGGRSS